MMKTKIALAALLACFALTPAVAATSKPAKGKAKSSKVVKKKTSSKGKKALVGAAAVGAGAAAAGAASANAAETRVDRRMSTLSMQYLTALWRMDPEGGIYVGKFDHAANLTIPNADTRAKQLAFANEWL
ncbi:MAG TPA: DUF885 domain-containing protein, partial [Massilia timonae]|nr:DUF885 domain-containing protein [Massilia timonae]